MAEKPRLAAVSGEREVPDYLGTFRVNLAHVVKVFRKSQVSRWTGLSDQTLTNMEQGRRGAGNLRTFLELATYMDIPPELWFLPPKKFAAALQERGPVPFFAPPRSSDKEASSLTDSGTADRSRYGRIKSKAVSKDVGNARLVQVALDLHENERAA